MKDIKINPYGEALKLQDVLTINNKKLAKSLPIEKIRYATVKSYDETTLTAIINYEHDIKNNDISLINKSGVFLNIGDRVLVKAINGNLSNAYVDKNLIDSNLDLVITADITDVVYNTLGKSPEPASLGTLTCVLKEKDDVVTPDSYKWYVPASRTLLSGSSTTSSFAPILSDTFDQTKNKNIITLEVKYKGQTIKQTVTINITKTQSNAIVGILSNENCSLSSDVNGNVYSYSSAVTTMYIYDGTTDDSVNWTVTASPSANIAGTLNGKQYSVTYMSTDSGYVDLIATRAGYASITKRFSLSKSKAGYNGSNGKGYILNVLDGIRTITYDAYGTNPYPSQTAFSCLLFENGNYITSGLTYSWSATGHLSGTSSFSTFTPTCASTFNANNNTTVSVTVTYAGQTITQIVPVAVTKVGNNGAQGIQGIPGLKGIDGANGNSFRSMGEWNSSTTYVNNGSFTDIVTFNGSSFYCVPSTNVNHQPSSATPPVSDAYWHVLAMQGAQGAIGQSGINGVSFRNLGAWESTRSYGTDSAYIDTVNYNGSLYSCKTPNINKTPEYNVGTYWYLMVAKGDTGAAGRDGIDANRLDWVNDWDGSKVFIKGDAIITPKIFSGINGGTSTNPILTGIAIGRDVLGGTDSSIGIIAYNANSVTFKVDSNGNVTIGKIAGKQIIVDAATGSMEIPNIDAGKITSGTIDAARINVDSLHVSKIYYQYDSTIMASFINNTTFYINGGTYSAGIGKLYFQAASINDNNYTARPAKISSSVYGDGIPSETDAGISLVSQSNSFSVLPYGIFSNGNLTINGALNAASIIGQTTFNTVPYISLNNISYIIPYSSNITRLNTVSGGSTGHYIEVISNGYPTMGVDAWVPSDSRLKKEIEYSSVNALDIISKIQHRKFKWKSDDSEVILGYVAHELKEIINEAVLPIKQPEGSELDEMLQISTQKLIPYLTKAVQELKIEIDSLKKNTV